MGVDIRQSETASCYVIPEEQALPGKGLKPTTGFNSLEGQVGMAYETHGLDSANSEFTRLCVKFFPE